MVPVVLLGVIWFIVPLYRRVIRLSTYEYFERRFGSFARYYSSIAFVLRQFSGMGTVLFLLAIALNNIIGGNMDNRYRPDGRHVAASIVGVYRAYARRISGT